MRSSFLKYFVIVFVLLTIDTSKANADFIANAVQSTHRSPVNLTRDKYRNPKETLDFFGIKPEMTVVEISPGRGWYTEILAHILKDNGTLYAAHFHESMTNPYLKRMLNDFSKRISKDPIYKNVKLTHMSLPDHIDIAPNGSADMVLTFRNVHNWINQHEYENKAFKAFYDALKPGGVLGVVEHRAPEESNRKWMSQNGYVTQSKVIALAESAGFKLVGTSEINANPYDTKDHPEGVWTLPPSLRLKKVDRQKYLTIGESDRMTLKFVK